MLIDHNQTKVGDELVVPSSGLRLIYVKVIRKNKNSCTCTSFRYTDSNLKVYEPDVSKHNFKYYLQDYVHRYLVKREEF